MKPRQLAKIVQAIVDALEDHNKHTGCDCADPFTYGDIDCPVHGLPQENEIEELREEQEKTFSLQNEINELIPYRDEAINLRAAITDYLGLNIDSGLDIIGEAIATAKNTRRSDVSPELHAQILAHYAAYTIFKDNRAESAQLLHPIAQETVRQLSNSGYRLVADEVAW